VQYDRPYLVSMLFADLLSLHLITLLMFFILVMLSRRVHYWRFHSKTGAPRA